MTRETFFDKYSATELGTTKLVPPNAILGQRGDLVKMLDISVPDSGAMPIVVSLRSEYSISAAGTGQAGFPIVAILQWGVGGAENQVEFDVPTSRTPDIIPGAPVNQPVSNIGGGVNIAVTTSHVSLYLRNDANLAPLCNALANDFVGALNIAKVLAFVSPGNRTNSLPIERVVYVAGGHAGAPLSNFTPGQAVFVTVPPFAKSVRFQRRLPGTSINVQVMDNVLTVYREFNVTVNNEGPYPLDPQTERLRLTNSSAIDIINLQAVFDVSPT